MTKDEIYMNQCIQLAKRGAGYVSPNPLVGCVIEKNYKILGKGYHKKFGEAHAEVNAIADAKKKGNKINGATLYVNLEPCSHYGKTPPCTDFIIKEEILEVVIGTTDPNKLVGGNGIKQLKNVGIKVTCGILEDKCKELNKFYFRYITKKLPYVTLKIAQSIDGKIALNNFDSKWISVKESRKFVHKLRSEYDSVLIGTNTAKHDNPELTVREVKGRNPVRFIIDRKLKLPKKDLKLFSIKGDVETFLITSNKKKIKKTNKKFSQIYIKDKKNNINIRKILKAIYKQDIASVLVEGGAYLFSQFARTGLFDDLYLIVAPKIIGKGISSFKDFEINKLKKSKILHLENKINSETDLILYYKNLNSK